MKLPEIPCAGCGRLFRPKHKGHRFHLKRCRRAHDLAVRSEYAKRWRRRHPARVRKQNRDYNRKPGKRQLKTRLMRRWRKAHPDRVRAIRLRAYPRALMRRKLTLGRKCSSCGTGDNVRIFAQSTICNACDVRGRRNGWDVLGRARYQDPRVKPEDRALLLALWEMAGSTWLDENQVGDGRVRLTDRDVASFMGTAAATVNRRLLPRVRRLKIRFKLEGVRGKRSKRMGEPWWLEFHPETLRRICGRVLDWIAHKTQEDHDDREDEGTDQVDARTDRASPALSRALTS